MDAVPSRLRAALTMPSAQYLRIRCAAGSRSYAPAPDLRRRATRFGYIREAVMPGDNGSECGARDRRLQLVGTRRRKQTRVRVSSAVRRLGTRRLSAAPAFQCRDTTGWLRLARLGNVQAMPHRVGPHIRQRRSSPLCRDCHGSEVRSTHDPRLLTTSIRGSRRRGRRPRQATTQSGHLRCLRDGLHRCDPFDGRAVWFGPGNGLPIDRQEKSSGLVRLTDAVRQIRHNTWRLVANPIWGERHHRVRKGPPLLLIRDVGQHRRMKHNKRRIRGRLSAERSQRVAS